MFLISLQIVQNQLSQLTTTTTTATVSTTTASFQCTHVHINVNNNVMVAPDKFFQTQHQQRSQQQTQSQDQQVNDNHLGISATNKQLVNLRAPRIVLAITAASSSVVASAAANQGVGRGFRLLGPFPAGTPVTKINPAALIPVGEDQKPSLNGTFNCTSGAIINDTCK